MTESEWLASTDPQPMLEYLRGKASDRKLRLFAVACARRVWHLLTDPRSLTAVEVAERYADGLATETELSQSFGLVLDNLRSCAWTPENAQELSANRVALAVALNKYRGRSWAHRAADAAEAAQSAVGQDEEQIVQSGLLRDIFGHLPFHPSPPLPPSILYWNDRLVPRLAQSIYDERQMPEGTLDPARLAILADALLDAGLEDESLLEHLRSPGPHVRGCHAVDLILGRS